MNVWWVHVDIGWIQLSAFEDFDILKEAPYKTNSHTVQHLL